MTKLNPFKNNNQRSRLYRRNTLNYRLTFRNNDQPLDLSQFSEIICKLYSKETEVFNHTLDDLTISGNDNQILEGTAHAEETDVEPGEYFFVIEFYTPSNIKKTMVALFAEIIDARSPHSTTLWEFEPEFEINFEQYLNQ